MEKSELREILNDVDPICLIKVGCPDDEYDPEIDIIISYLENKNYIVTIEELRSKVEDIFNQMFGIDCLKHIDKYEFDSVVNKIFDKIGVFLFF